MKKISEDLEKIKPLRQVKFHPALKNTISELSKLNMRITVTEETNFGTYDDLVPISEGNLELLDEKICSYQLNAKNGLENTTSSLVASYDESINKFGALEGTGYLMSHALVYLWKREYLPISMLCLYFFTKIGKKTNIPQCGIIVTDDIGYASKRVYVNDKVNFLKENIIPDAETILFIDGPIIGGDWYVLMIRAVKEYFNEKKVIPIFIVKNSQSSIIVDSFPELNGKYNSDMHWAYSKLKNGERSSFFIYQDKINSDNARVFCYLKPLRCPPLRIEFHPTTYHRYEGHINTFLDMIYYLTLVQGDPKNMQVRPIAIAEKYARETARLFNLEKIIRSSHLIPTLNQERFGWTS
jgi:hypothetical protein